MFVWFCISFLFIYFFRELFPLSFLWLSFYFALHWVFVGSMHVGVWCTVCVSVAFFLRMTWPRATLVATQMLETWSTTSDTIPLLFPAWSRPLSPRGRPRCGELRASRLPPSASTAHRGPWPGGARAGEQGGREVQVVDQDQWMTWVPLPLTVAQVTPLLPITGQVSSGLGLARWVTA